ncbi:hypothetical protein Tco_1206014, partial [Tanacetum coccineum]
FGHHVDKSEIDTTWMNQYLDGVMSVHVLCFMVRGPGGSRQPSSTSQTPFENPFYGSSSGLIRCRLASYSEKILGSSFEYVQSNHGHSEPSRSFWSTLSGKFHHVGKFITFQIFEEFKLAAREVAPIVNTFAYDQEITNLKLTINSLSEREISTLESCETLKSSVNIPTSPICLSDAIIQFFLLKAVGESV